MGIPTWFPTNGSSTAQPPKHTWWPKRDHLWRIGIQVILEGVYFGVCLVHIATNTQTKSQICMNLPMLGDLVSNGAKQTHMQRSNGSCSPSPKSTIEIAIVRYSHFALNSFLSHRGLQVDT